MSYTIGPCCQRATGVSEGWEMSGRRYRLVSIVSLEVKLMMEGDTE